MKLEDLFLLAKKGDGKAFEQIVLLTERSVYNLALSILKNKENAEDVTQETYLRLWRTVTVTDIGSPRSYILRTARNLALDHLRKSSRSAEVDAELEFEPEDTSAESRPDLSYLQMLEAEAIRESIAELPQSAREIIILRDVERLPYSEIAKMLEISEGTLKSKLYRARERLRQIIISKNIL